MAFFLRPQFQLLPEACKLFVVITGEHPINRFSTLILRIVSKINDRNEAFSDDQGWVNGSLRSANNVLKVFGIPPLPQATDPLP